MAITGITNSFTNSGLYKGWNKATSSIYQKVCDAIPNTVYSNEKAIDKIGKAGKKISSAEQRLILGVTALMSQPFIDANNKSVDEKTRKVSVARTIAKIIAGTLTGFAIRKVCIKGIQAWSQVPKEGVPKIKSLFTPKGVTDTSTEAFKQYQNALGTVGALVVMMFTNFLIDAPLTKFLTNALVKKSNEKDAKAAQSAKTSEPPQPPQMPQIKTGGDK